jgi:predicted RNA-binding protein YlxR (DUF448 family)
VTPERKSPARTCVGCGASRDKRDLVRIVRSPEGDVSVDGSGKANGRGAYLCPRHECFDTAAEKRRITHSLKTNLKDDDVDRLRREFAELLGHDDCKTGA